jgi:hypothetical protein
LRSEFNGLKFDCHGTKTMRIMVTMNPKANSGAESARPIRELREKSIVHFQLIPQLVQEEIKFKRGAFQVELAEYDVV